MVKTGLFKFVIKTLYSQPKLSVNDLLDIFKEENQGAYTAKRSQYSDDAATDKQLKAEIGACMTGKITSCGGKPRADHFIKTQSDGISLFELSDIGKQHYYDINIEQDEDITEDQINENIIENESSVGYVYLLKAALIWGDVYKIGITQNPTVRLGQLNTQTDKYSMFGFKQILSEKINHYDKVEKILHSTFHKYRISKDKGCADTELFIGPFDFDIELEFKSILEELKSKSYLGFVVPITQSV